jgi:uncharacterized repeat protein (TIGR01451 family)
LNGTPAPFTFNLSAQPSPTFTTMTCGNLPGEAWQLTIFNNMGAGGGARNVLVSPVDPVSGAISQVILPSVTVINVNSVAVYDAAYPGGGAIVTTLTGTTVYVRSVISDPFGSYDITSASILITDSTGSVRVNGAAMMEVADSGAATKTYEYAYAVPAGGPAGNWTARVIGVEGTEGTVNDLAQTALNVVIPMPDILVVKSVQIVDDPYNGGTNPKAIPGATMLYDVTVTNQGIGPADAVTVVDGIPLNTALRVADIGAPGSGPVAFLNGATPSGLTYTFIGLGSGADSLEFSNDNGTSWAYTPTADGNGVDLAVTNIRVRPAGTFSSASGPNQPSFILRFQIRVK